MSGTYRQRAFTVTWTNPANGKLDLVSARRPRLRRSTSRRLARQVVAGRERLFIARGQGPVASQVGRIVFEVDPAGNETVPFATPHWCSLRHHAGALRSPRLANDGRGERGVPLCRSGRMPVARSAVGHAGDHAANACAVRYHDPAMSQHVGALAWAEAQVAAARDDPAARLALLARTYHGPTGRAPRHLPFRRAALSFMRWQAHRGVLDPLDASPPGSAWWRAVNERLLRDGCEAVALVGGLVGEPSSHSVRLWLEFIARPTGRNWYRAHNASIVGAYLEHRHLAEAESAPERFFLNVALVRVLSRTPSSGRRAWRWVRSLRSAACSATPGSGWLVSSSHSAACSRTAIRSPSTSNATSPTSSVLAGCSITR